MLIRKSYLENRIAELDTQQYALKIAANSGFGALGNQYFRYFNINNAEAITQTGQYIIRTIEKYINQYLSKYIGNEKDRIALADTDSIVCILEDVFNSFSNDEQKMFSDIQKRIDFIDFFANEKIQPKINQIISAIENQLNGFPGFISMVRENISNAIIVTGKKHYIMNVYDAKGFRYTEPKKKIMGIESVKTSTPKLCRNLINDTIDFFFTKDNEFLIKHIQKIKDIIFKEKDLSLISFPRGVQNLKKYSLEDQGKEGYASGTPIHVRGSLRYNKWIKQNNLQNKYNYIQEGEKIKFAYLKLPNVFNEHVIAWNTSTIPKELQLEKFIDKEQHFQIGYMNVIEKLLEAVGWVDKTQNNIDDWF